MAVIKLENIAATASITIQLIKDYSMYESEIISSNGTIFQSTDTDTTLTFRAYKGIEEVTNKINDIEWSKFYFDGDELKEDASWGINKKDLKKVVLDKDDIEEKSIIQASGYSIIEGNRELVTTARITVIKISDVYISDVTPISPSDKMMWMDTNQTPPALKIWSDELGYWTTSGMEVPGVKNLIRNSNFWSDINDYYTIYNSSHILTPVRVGYQNKQWLNLKSKNANSQRSGVYQHIQYPIVQNSNYILSLIGYRENGPGDEINIMVESIDKDGKTSIIVDEKKQLNTSITTVSINFKTLNDTEELKVYYCTEDRQQSNFYITELSLYNSSVYYPWELCLEDVDKQMNTKLDNNRLSVFNTLMDNNNYKAIYESENQYYIRADYIEPAVVSQENYNNAFNNLSNRVTQLETKNTQLETKYNNLETKHNNLETKYNTLEAKYTALETKHNNEISAINAELTSIKARLLALETPAQPTPPSEPTE